MTSLQEVLGYFYRNRQNIIDDSICPEHVPHIVITPVEEDWESQYTQWQNRTDFQCTGYLTVPVSTSSWQPGLHPSPSVYDCVTEEHPPQASYTMFDTSIRPLVSVRITEVTQAVC